LNPDLLSVSEAVRIKQELDRIEIPLSGICLNKQGISTSPWTIDGRLASTPLFEFEFLSGGLHSRDDLGKIDTRDLVAHFMTANNH